MKPDSRPSSCVQALQQRVAAQLGGQRQVLLAYSGGLDSTVLLDALTALRTGEGGPAQPLSLRAMHVHHGLSRHADSWLMHCDQQCRLRGVPFSAVRVTLTDTAEGLEAAARGARYQALQQALLPGEALLTAQHQDDQAETLLLALKRGSGPAGLAAMAASAPFHGHRLLRPLLTVSRAQLEDYAQARQLAWVEDDSNGDDRFDRNFLRLHMLPPVLQRWPQFAENVARSAQLCAEQEQLLDELLAPTLAALMLPEGALHLTPLLTMSAPKRSALLRRWLAGRGARMPSRQQLDILWQEVVLSRPDASPQLLLDGQWVRRYRDRLYLLPAQTAAPLPQGLRLPWPASEVQLPLGYGLGVLLRQCVMPLSNVNGQDSLPATEAQTPACALPPAERMAAAKVDGQQVAARTEVSANASAAAPSASLCAAGQSVSAVIRAPLAHERVSVRFGSGSGAVLIVGRRHGRPLKKLWQELGIPPWQRAITPLLFYNETLIAAPGVFVTQDGQAGEEGPHWRLHWLPHAPSQAV